MVISRKAKRNPKPADKAGAGEAHSQQADSKQFEQVQTGDAGKHTGIDRLERKEE